MAVYEIMGKPIPLQRHRHAGNRTYDPQKKEKENLRWKIKSFVLSTFPLTGPLRLEIEYHLPIPTSFPKKARLDSEGYFQFKKPDLSNLIKFTEDTFNEIIWKDDSMISEIKAKKIYSVIPKTIFLIEQIKDEFVALINTQYQSNYRIV